jgi:hypothetical protein
MLFGLGVGSGDVNFDADILAANNSLSDDDIVAEFWVGYRFDSKVILEGGATPAPTSCGGSAAPCASQRERVSTQRTPRLATILATRRD